MTLTVAIWGPHPLAGYGTGLLDGRKEAEASASGGGWEKVGVVVEVSHLDWIESPRVERGAIVSVG